MIIKNTSIDPLLIENYAIVGANSCTIDPAASGTGEEHNDIGDVFWFGDRSCRSVILL